MADQKHSEIAGALARDTGVAEENVSKVLEALRLPDALAEIDAVPGDLGANIEPKDLVVGVHVSKGILQI